LIAIVAATVVTSIGFDLLGVIVLSICLICLGLLLAARGD
jgi:hypothetical protein